ncbi:mitochondrial substrate carrier family protein [Tieghemostelium lacteum]|uniref:Mitochondrial substrate carrier family protein n=1 Tax=Tieghemostelium lacteum TaxID=361077 RepID=A0A152A2Y1_TIELA|nr:mitochondrial substrate carrier family protein [Tieghemostelium lacteum]|eukprot:KYR00569.1 mitochondrial substrate carrier family protein [Tieghemostelium lacteum]
MQVSHRNKSIVSTVQNMIERPGGVKNLYSGLKPTLLGLVPSWAIYFTTYNYLKTVISPRLLGSDQNSTSVHILSAAGAGVVNSTFTNPIWVVKTRFITQEMKGRQRKYTGIIQCFISIYKEEGFAAFYKGLGPSLLGIAHVGVQFPLYEKFKLILAEKNRMKLGDGGVSQTSESNLSIIDIMVASSVSKIIASMVAYPHEVLRSRLQDSSPDSPYRYKGSLLSNFKQIYYEEGIRGLYKGMGVNLLRVTPSCVITFTSYEYIKKYLLSMSI